MADPGYTKADLELFEDLERAASAVGVTPCLIGAGAIRLGTSLEWGGRLGRMTSDWDFAVRVESWEQFDHLSAALISAGGGFEQAAEPHRFRHRRGGVLDVLPYGALERPHGTVLWPDGTALDTTGLSVLDEHSTVHELGTVSLHLASRPAVVGLKLLAYRFRRPGIRRDIGDVYAILEAVETEVSEERILAEGLERLESEEVAFSEIGAYLLGREVGRAFAEPAREVMGALLDAAERPEDQTIGDVLRSEIGAGASRDLVARRLRALRLGLVDH